MNDLQKEFLEYCWSNWESWSVDNKKEFVSLLTRDIKKSETGDKLVEAGINNTICPHCNSTKIIKKGHRSWGQCFYCNDCKKYYTLKTKTPFAYSKKDIDLWYTYIDLMCHKFTIKEISKKLGIHYNTAFLWRHKILAAATTLKSEKLSGIVEADETYFRESQKGNKQITRIARKSGKSKLTHKQLFGFYGLSEEEYKKTQKKRGLSNDQVCVLTAMDRKNNIFGKPAGYGKMKENYLKVLKPQIAKNSTLITDGEPVYKKLKVAKHKSFEHGLSKDRVYNIGRTDELHTSMKGLINGVFRGVATKYLDNYVNYVGMLKTRKLDFDTLISCNNHTTRKSLKSKTAF